MYFAIPEAQPILTPSAFFMYDNFPRPLFDAKEVVVLSGGAAGQISEVQGRGRQTASFKDRVNAGTIQVETDEAYKGFSWWKSDRCANGRLSAALRGPRLLALTTYLLHTTAPRRYETSRIVSDFRTDVDIPYQLRTPDFYENLRRYDETRRRFCVDDLKEGVSDLLVHMPYPNSKPIDFCMKAIGSLPERIHREEVILEGVFGKETAQKTIMGTYGAAPAHIAEVYGEAVRQETPFAMASYMLEALTTAV